MPCLSKILERLVFNRVQNFLSKHEVLSNCQYGFRPGHSTETALADALDKLNKAIANRQTSIGIFLDLSKAFDTVDHSILLTKLSHYGMRGLSLNWFKSYLTNRKQYTHFKSAESDLATVRCGVPQGTILGPLLFVIYVNDITAVSQRSSLILLADDTNIFFSDDDPDCLGNTVCTELRNYCNWFWVNKLSVNTSKTKFMVFNNSKCNNHHNINIYINSDKLDLVNKIKFLGVIIHSKLTWHEHIHYLSSHVAKGVGIIGRLKYILPRSVLRTLYLSTFNILQ